jgi:hypothetical protein
MRGLTPAERARLLQCEVTTAADLCVELDDSDIATNESLAAQGRMHSYQYVDADGDDVVTYWPTDAGRLALRLWPATAATPGAGGQ